MKTKLASLIKNSGGALAKFDQHCEPASIEKNCRPTRTDNPSPPPSEPMCQNTWWNGTEGRPAPVALLK